MTDNHVMERLLHELLDGTITPDDFQRLQSALLSDPALRKRYYDLTCTEQLLAERFESADIAHARQSAHRGWSKKRQHGHPWAISLSAAAAIVLIGFAALFLIHLRAPKVQLAASTDGTYSIDGKASTVLEWEPSQQLSVKNGVVVARLNQATQVCVESPAEILLEDKDGSFKLISGRAWVETNSHAPDFTAGVGGARIRHLGTRYGIIAGPGGRGEVHVEDGKVAIDRNDQPSTILVGGEASQWSSKALPHPVDYAASAFQHSLPSESLLFSDDFSEASGTALSGKNPDVGQPWMVLREKAETLVGGGLLDTSGGYRHLIGSFRNAPSGEGRKVFVVTVTTASPSQVSDKKQRLGGSESIRLWDAQGSPLYSLVALAKDQHRWRLRDDVSGDESASIDFSALDENQLTICFDPGRKRLSLYEGGSAQGTLLIRMPATARSAPVSLSLENNDGGDLALRRIEVSSIAYSGNPAE